MPLPLQGRALVELAHPLRANNGGVTHDGIAEYALFVGAGKERFSDDA